MSENQFCCDALDTANRSTSALVVTNAELRVFTHRVQDDARIGFLDICISQDALDLVVHIVGVDELSNRDDVVIASRLIHTHHLRFITKRVCNIR